MVWAWMQREPYALGAEHEEDYGLGMDAKETVCSWSTREIMVWAWNWHGCSGNGMLLEHEGDYVLGMDAKVTVCSWNTKEIMV